MYYQTIIITFDVKNDPPCLAKAGDKIQFIPIDLETYQNLIKQIELGTYLIESEIYE